MFPLFAAAHTASIIEAEHLVTCLLYQRHGRPLIPRLVCESCELGPIPASLPQTSLEFER